VARRTRDRGRSRGRCGGKRPHENLPHEGPSCRGQLPRAGRLATAPWRPAVRRGIQAGRAAGVTEPGSQPRRVPGLGTAKVILVTLRAGAPAFRRYRYLHAHMKVSLPDGTPLELQDGATGEDAARAIGE